LLALLGAHPILHVSRIRVNKDLNYVDVKVAYIDWLIEWFNLRNLYGLKCICKQWLCAREFNDEGTKLCNIR
jgi:hypothetical protein